MRRCSGGKFKKVPLDIVAGRGEGTYLGFFGS